MGLWISWIWGCQLVSPTTPEITYGFGVSAKYKGFDISTFFQGTARRSFWIDVKATAPFVAYRYKSDELKRLQSCKTSYCKPMPMITGLKRTGIYMRCGHA